MKPILWKCWLLLATWVAAGGCAVTGVGVGYGVQTDYVGGFYEPYGYGYGGWGPAYRVGPRWGGGSYRRDGDHRGAPGPGAGRGQGPGRPYRAAPPTRRMPSIPNRSRGH